MLGLDWLDFSRKCGFDRRYLFACVGAHTYASLVTEWFQSFWKITPRHHHKYVKLKQSKKRFDSSQPFLSFKIMSSEETRLLDIDGHTTGTKRFSLDLLLHGEALENTGSTARDHLSNERTYLAWMRTALSLIGPDLGFLKWNAVSDATGYATALIGIVALIATTYRSYRNMQLIQQGLFEPNIQGILIIVITVVLCIGSLFVMQFSVVL